MLYFTKRKSDCTGCTACLAVCPIHCITMMKDEEGFSYPVASDSCIKCGKCKKVCPIENTPQIKENNYKQQAYCGVTRNNLIWQRSASGGAFSEICRHFGDEKTIVCGAAWNELDVHHICVEGVDKIAPLCKSKYVASLPENVFSEIKQYLQCNKKVIFCGTPCQVAGLNKYLNHQYDNLLTIDLICHGVGSPDVFKDCLKIIGDQLDIKIVGYEFRSKNKAYQTDYLQRIHADGQSPIMLSRDPYIQLFLSQNCLRPSCGGNCRFRRQEREGDLTIADFKGLIKVFPHLYGTKRNYSSIIVNTPKGGNVITEISKTMEILPCSLEDIKEYNPLFYRQTWESKDRDTFFNDYIQDPLIAINKYTDPVQIYENSLKKILWSVAPLSVRRMFLRFKDITRQKRTK